MEKMKKYGRASMPKGKHLTVGTHVIEGGHPQHWHSYFEIEIILSGSGKYVINDVEYDIRRGSVFFLTSTDFHYLRVDEDTELINISFDNEILDDKDATPLLFKETQKNYTFESDDYERLVNAAYILLREYETDADCQRPMLQYILKCLLRKNGGLSYERSNAEHNRGIKNAIMYMEMHFSEKITLETVAAAAGYQAAYFSELFAKVTGETYINTLKKLRIGHAKSMLASGFTVSGACFQSGFGSLSNFLEAFKHECGMTPGEYRKRAAKAPILNENTFCMEDI